MTTSSIRAKIDCPIERVWGVVTAVDDYSWRSDLSGTEILDERRFVEYAKGGFATTFTVTAMETCRRWEFDMENANMTGHWSGVFTAGDSATEIEFTECVEAKRLLMRPFVKAYLKKQQASFVADLRRRCEGAGR